MDTSTAQLRDGVHASRSETAALVAGVLSGGIDLEAFGRWLVALADLGESAAEIAGVAEALRGRMLPVARGHATVADTCGTGGDGSGSFNISTAAALVVAPYSFYATQKFGGLVVSDRTMGQMMWLGNNDFPPMAFDWGSGQLSKRAYERYEHRGRKHCGFKRDPVRQDTCEAAAGKAWILANPVAFLERIPVRVSQMLTPHSFLTRHLRWGRWRGMPQEVDEALIVSVVGFSFLTLVGGTIGIGARGRSWYAATAACLVLYHVAAIAVLAGLSRYRLPLEPLWTVFVGGLLADPRGAWAAFKTDRLRLVTTAVLSLALIAVMLRYLPAGWPWWARW